MKKKLKIFILASVLLNVLTVGIILGHVLKRLGYDHQIPPFSAEQLNLSEQKLEQLLQILHAVHLDNLALYKEVRQVRENALSILTAETFDEAAYQKQVEILHELRGQMMYRIANVVKKLAKTLNHTEKLALAEMLRHPPPLDREGFKHNE